MWPVKRKNSSVFSLKLKRLLWVSGILLWALKILLFTFSLGAQSIPRFRFREQQSHDFFRRALLFYHNQHYAAAREFLYKSLNIYPHFYLARRYLGNAYYYSGNWNEALEHWEFLNKSQQDTYPLVYQDSQLLRFRLGRTKSPEKYVFLRAFHSNTWPGYSFERPTDIAFGNEGELYLSSLASENIIGFSPSGNAVQEISGPFYAGLQTPLASGVDSKGNIYVSEYKEDRVRVFSKTGREIFRFGESGSGPGQFHGPTGLVIHQDSLFAADAGNRRIQKFDLTGGFLIELGKDLGEKAPLHPTGLAVSSENILYAADRDGARILRFALDGNYLGDIQSAQIKRPRGLHVHEKSLVIADEERGVVFYHLTEKRWSVLENLLDSKGRPVYLNRPFSARIDKTGGLYVADYGSSRLLVFVPLGMRTSNLNCRIQRVDTSAFPQIAVFVSAESRSGEPLQGLKSQSFLLYENDARMKPIKSDNIVPYNQRVSTALVKENSSFYGKNYNSYLPSVMGKTLASLRISDMIYLIQAGRDARIVYTGLERRRILRLLAQREDETENPNLGKGLYEALTHLTKRIGPRSVVLLVSGKAYPEAFSQYSLSRIGQYALSHGIPIQILSYENEEDPQKRKEVIALYQGLAETTRGNYFRAFDRKALENFYDFLSAQKDHRYIITYTTTLSKKFQGRYTDVRLKVKYLGTSGLANSGYFVP